MVTNELHYKEKQIHRLRKETYGYWKKYSRGQRVISWF